MEHDPLTKKFLECHANDCAARTVTPLQKINYLLIAAALMVLLFFRWDFFVAVLTVFLAFWYSLAVIFRGAAAFLSLSRKSELRFSPEAVAELHDEDLPVYTILLPLFKESAVAPKLLKNIGALDYPHDKLDVKLLIEANDDETRQTLAREELPAYCSVLVIPPGIIQTKPRACNYGLAEAKGRFCVIYDAEDEPEKDQLKKAVLAFRNDKSGKLLCVQAKLNYFNARYNWLTRLFTVEYSTYFDLTLGGYQRFGLPLPLGGTSNHFRTELLQKVGPWDPFNVTEDCDLGLRIYEKGYRTALLDSTTYEEANSKLGNWLRQRSRWVKGFIQTHFVHYRSLWGAVRKLGLWGAMGGYLAIGGGSLMMLVNPVFWCLLILYVLLLIHGYCHGIPLEHLIVGPQTELGSYQGIFGLRAWPLFYSGAGENCWYALFSRIFCGISAALLAANLLFIGTGVAACFKRKNYDLIPAALCMPFYWMLISIAAWKGFIQIFTKPFYWEKTTHGLTTTQNSNTGD